MSRLATKCIWLKAGCVSSDSHVKASEGLQGPALARVEGDRDGARWACAQEVKDPGSWPCQLTAGTLCCPAVVPGAGSRAGVRLLPVPFQSLATQAGTIR